MGGVIKHVADLTSTDKQQIKEQAIANAWKVLEPNLREVRVLFDHLPFSELYPNALRSTHWAVRSEAQGVARTEALIAGKKLKVKLPIELCEVEEIFTIPTRRHMDIEGIMGAAKAWLDGIVDSGIIPDDDWKHVRKLSGSVVYEKGVEKTEIIIREVSA